MPPSTREWAFQIQRGGIPIPSAGTIIFCGVYEFGTTNQGLVLLHSTLKSQPTSLNCVFHED